MEGEGRRADQIYVLTALRSDGWDRSDLSCKS